MTRHELADAPGAQCYTPYRRRLSADEREFGREVEVGEGQDVCHSCNAPFDEQDLWRAGGDGDPACSGCVMRLDLRYGKMRFLMTQAAAILACEHQTSVAKSLAAEIQNLLDG